MNLLIVDDHLINLKLLRAQLESEGHAVFEAHDGVAALALLERQHVDVVISDILMPRMDGYSLCYEIRKHTRLCDLPIIIYTSTYLSPGDEKLALEMGADKYLKKPVSVETIITALHEVIAQPHAAPRPDELREVETFKNYNERLVSKLKEKNTELQAQTEVLRESELQYRTLADSGRALIWSSGLDKKCDYLNQPWLMFTGRTLEQELGDGWAEGVHPDDLARCFEIYTTAFDRRECFSMDYRLRRHDGEFRWIQDDGSPRYDSQWNFLGYIGHCLDITARKQAEEENKTILRTMIDGFYLVDLEGRILEANDAYCAMIGYSREELRKIGVKGVEAIDTQEVIKQRIQRILETGSDRFETKHIRKDGRVIDVEAAVNRIRNLGRLFVFMRDITARKQAEQILEFNAQEGWTGRHEDFFARLVELIGRTLGVDYAFIGRIKDAQTVQTIGLYAKGKIAPDIEYSTRSAPCHNVIGKMLCHHGEKLQELFPDDALLAEMGAQSYLGIPLMDSSGKPLGLLAVLDTKPMPDARSATTLLQIAAVRVAGELERIAAEEALRESERRFQTLADTSPVGIFRTDAQGQTTYVNPQWCQITGLSVTDALGHGWLRAVHPEDLEKLVQGWQAATQVHGASKADYRLVRPDGTISWAMGLAVPEKDDTGLVAGYVGTITDITERKRAEETIARERHLLRTLVDVLPETFYVKDLDSRFLVVNETVAKQYGKDTPAQLLGLSDVDLYPAGLAAEFRAEEMKVFAGEPLISHEDSMVFPDGRKHTVLTTKLPFRDSQGRICGLVGIGQDITGHKRAEKEIQILAHAVETTNELICITDMNDRFTFVNKAFLQGYGYTAEEVLGQTPVLLASPNNPPELSRNIMSSARTQGWRGELINRRKDGSEFPISLNVSPIHDATGQTVGLMGMAVDITEKKLLEEKFLHAQRLESIGLLSAGIAHDLNNVLAPIMLTAPLLRDSLSTARDLKTLDMLEKSAERGAGLVKQILGFAHTSTGEFRPMQVKHFARDLISVIEQTFPKSIQLEQQISSDLWPVQGNATQIHQVLLNLCVNARDAMPSGGTLRLTAANLRLDAAGAGAIPGALPGTWVVLEVADTGAGIPPEMLEHIWESFFTTKGAGKGTGLGLATVRGIVVSHHGFVELHTEVGRGSTFRVFLPAVESEAPRSSSAAPVAILDGHGELILVVDDEAPIRNLVAGILGQHGYRVVSCGDGLEAITLFNAHPDGIALVVTDVDMPRLGGVALARALLQLRPDLRLLAMSGLSRRETDGADVPEIQKLAHAFLRKPFTIENLLGTVHRLLQPPGKT